MRLVRINPVNRMPYGKEPTTREAWLRFTWNVRNLFSRDHNPFVASGEGGFKGAKRTAFEDLFHSLENVYRVWRRNR